MITPIGLSTSSLVLSARYRRNCPRASALSLLEFLVKDYFISQSDSLNIDEADIKKKPIGPCIKNHIENSRVIQLAERAAWLGNDETHYKRKWTDRDLEDLKTLLHLLINETDNAIVGDEYIESMRRKETDLNTR